METISKEQFVKQYCERSNITEQELYEEYGQIALPCACNDDQCQGWAMVSNDALHIKIHNDLYAPREI